MDAVLLFAALVGLMIAVLSALGYALHRITQQASVSTSDKQPCQQCGYAAPMAQPCCPQCGAAWTAPGERLHSGRTA